MTLHSIATTLSVDGHRLDGRVPLKAADGHLIPDCTAPRVSDAELQFWGEVFCANNLYAQGVTFETFVTAPQATLEALARRAQAQYDDDAPEPLLPAQARVQRRLDLQTPVGALERLEAELDRTPGAVRRNGTWIERLRHRAWPRHADRRIC